MGLEKGLESSQSGTKNITWHKTRKVEDRDLEITLAGVGYIGLTLAVLLAQNHEITAITAEAKVERLNRRVSPVQDDDI